MCEIKLDFDLENISAPNNISAPDNFRIVPTLESPTYEYFFKNYLVPNLPCVIKDVTQEWRAPKIWVAKNDQPNWHYLDGVYGSSKVTVYDCTKKYFNTHKTIDWTFHDYLNYWQFRGDQRFRDSNKLLYLKDWHLKNEFPDLDFYHVPEYFASDWLNEYFVDNKEDDYRFVYMGPRDTWTPLHADVFMSYSWSANVLGRKRWLMFPPGEENKLKDEIGNFYHDVRELLSPDIRYFDILQNPGEAVFVPTGWYHQVVNIDDAISVNHNWVNGCNLKAVWKALQAGLDDVKKQIQDCEDMDNYFEQTQLLLSASHGMDLEIFFKFLQHIATRRIDIINNSVCETLYNGYSFDKTHALFDLKCIEPVLESFLKHEDFADIFIFSKKPRMLFLTIRQTIREAEQWENFTSDLK